MGWPKADILAALEIKATRGEIPDARSIEIDTRRMMKGGMFLAFRGEKVDGHAYLSVAAEKGAVLAIVEEFQDHDLPQIQVADMRKALWQLAKYARCKQGKAAFVAITGSVGKTSTRSLLHCALSHSLSCYASSGNFNNDLGMPLCLAQMGCTASWDVGVFELGMSAPNELTPLSQLLRPNIAAILNVHAVHQENFPDIAGIARAKAEIFAGLEANGVALIPNQTEFAQIFIDAIPDTAQRQIFNDSDEYSWKKNILYLKNNRITQDFADVLQRYHDNILCVAAVCSALNVSPEAWVPGIQSWQPEAGRGAIQTMELSKSRRVTVIDDSYNASLPSMLACLEDLARRDASRKIAVLGDMKELGTHSAVMHQELIARLNEYNFDAVFVAGEEMLLQAQTIQNLVRARLQAEDLVQPLRDYLQDGDMLAFKASRSVGLDRIIFNMNNRNH